ncbi:unnamed protein product [Tuber melanosporum]|uniref:(Perigord truffle) hypothetical protein n=1 Tax=Tuber melanosporum (strain Mel28) TaxID=656061 RepID=D5GQ27_TUBMM|nr:uncharacterized protein GSTUM_00012172001 [Tuber melanosporum]CAZ86620.1 unnamed protein product [Tuber melanosporum]
MSTHDMSSGLAARRQQHPLPQFHLNTTRAPYSSFGGNSVLTPPPMGPNEITSPLSSGGSSAGTVSAMGQFSPVGYWPATSNSSPYGYGSASANASYTSGGIQSSTNSNFGVRGFTSPGVTLNRGNSRPSSPATGELVHPPSFDNPSPYTGGIPISTSAGGHPIAAVAGSGLPSIGPGSNVHGNYAAAYLQPNQHPNQPHPPMNSQSQQNHDPYSPQGSLPPPNPSQPYYGQQQQQGLQMSPSSVMGRQMNSGPQYPPLVPLQPNYKPQYPLPGVGGPVMGGILHGHPGMMTHHHPGAHHQQQQTERPFKCDQCPQSFNRNHDLKRHKRIHLAVKPFPCNNCEKSFSRKDALKRHRLVKGCGKNDHLQGQPSPATTGQDSKQSPSVSPVSARNPGPERNASPPGSAGGMIKHDR